MSIGVVRNNCLKAHEGLSFEWSVPGSFAEVENWTKVGVYRLASYFTDPLCKARESIVKFQVVDELPAHPYLQASLSYFNQFLSEEFKIESIDEMTRTLEKCYLVANISFFSLLSPLGVIGIFLRFMASNLESERFIHYKGQLKEQSLQEDTLKLAHWNICGIKAGYDTGEGGQVPLREALLPEKETRLFKIVERLKKLDADLISGNEVFDIVDAEYIAYHLKDQYAHFVFNCGGRSQGPNSGLFFASKFAVEEISFEAFPKEMLVDSAKYCEKGILKVAVHDNKGSIATVLLTHLQHSEEPGQQPPFYSSMELEKQARKQQLQVLKEKVQEIKDQDVIVVGDLNLDDQEFERADPEFYRQFEKTVHYDFPENEESKTWLGDHWYSRFTNRDSFLFGPCKEKRKPSEAVNLDHILVRKRDRKDLTPLIQTTLKTSGYDPEKLKRESLSDHEILEAVIQVKKRGI